MTPKSIALWVVSLVVFCWVQAIHASFPEPDGIVYGALGGHQASQVTASWPAGQAAAEAAGNGFFLIRIPVDDTTQNAGGGRAIAQDPSRSGDLPARGSREHPTGSGDPR